MATMSDFHVGDQVALRASKDATHGRVVAAHPGEIWVRWEERLRYEGTTTAHRPHELQKLDG